MKGQAEQASLAAARNERAHVEKGRGPELRTVPDANAAGLLQDEQAARAVARIDDAERRAEPGDDRLEAERDLRVGAACRPRQRGRRDEEGRRHGVEDSRPSGMLWGGYIQW
jgi:hypothetical protein